MRGRILAPLIVIALASAANFHASAAESAVADAPNVFAGPLHAGGGSPNVIASGENLADPFEEGHPIESSMYRSLYYSHYHALFYSVNAPVLEKLPDAKDGSGRPLWFDAAKGEADLAHLVSGLLQRSQFADLDRLFQDWSDPSDRLADGRSKLVAFDYAISNMCQTVECWPLLHKTIQRWRSTAKNSPAAAIAEVNYWVAYAWQARGYGYVNTVDAGAWPLFEERLNKAQAVLDESKAYAHGSSWTRSAIDISMDRGVPAIELIALYSEQAQIDRFNSPIYDSMARALTPKWGGDWQRLDAFVRSATKNTKDVEGDSMYARLYWNILNDNVHLFSDTLASWPLMKKGFEDMNKLYPHSSVVMNRFAAAACMAEDKDTFQAVMFRLGSDVLLDAWPTNYSADLCMHKYERQHL